MPGISAAGASHILVAARMSTGSQGMPPVPPIYFGYQVGNNEIRCARQGATGSAPVRSPSWSHRLPNVFIPQFWLGPYELFHQPQALWVVHDLQGNAS